MISNKGTICIDRQLTILSKTCADSCTCPSSSSWWPSSCRSGSCTCPHSSGTVYLSSLLLYILYMMSCYGQKYIFTIINHQYLSYEIFGSACLMEARWNLLSYYLANKRSLHVRSQGLKIPKIKIEK